MLSVCFGSPRKTMQNHIEIAPKNYCKRFAQSAGPGILQLTSFDALEPLLRYCRSLFCDLGVMFGAFCGNFCTLGVIFGALWVYFLCPKTDWGAKGAPMGKNPKIPAPFWSPFWCYFSILFVFEVSIQRASEKTSKNISFWTESNLEN